MEHTDTPTVAIAYVPDEIDRKYDEMLRIAPQDWYAILEDDTELIHAPTWSEVADELARRGIPPGTTFIMKSPGPPPYLVL